MRYRKHLIMRYFCWVIFFGFLSCQEPSSKLLVNHRSQIDRLYTEEQVQKFVDKHLSLHDFKVTKAINYESDYLGVSFVKSTADSLGIDKSFYKADFDGNGYTDIMVSGKDYNLNITVIMNHPKNTFTAEYPAGEFSGECALAEVGTIDNTPVLYYYSEQEIYADTSGIKSLTKKTLAYRFGAFIEYNGSVKLHSISKIEYQTFPTFGFYPVFNMVLEKNAEGLLDAMLYNANKNRAKKIIELEGKYTGKIKSSDYNEITGLLNYIDFPNLRDHYSVNISDKSVGLLTITYDNGKIKTIYDYGKQGTFGLRRVHDLLAAMRFNQVWKKQGR